MHIEVYSDGSGMTKKTPGGYGFVVVVEGIEEYEGNGYLEFATNNDCELAGAIEGLYSLSNYLAGIEYPEEHVEVTLVSDSQIILNWANGTNDFKQLDKMDKYDKLMGLMRTFNVRTRWVKGHAGNEHNERCDKLANAARLQKEIK